MMACHPTDQVLATQIQSDGSNSVKNSQLMSPHKSCTCCPKIWTQRWKTRLETSCKITSLISSEMVHQTWETISLTFPVGWVLSTKNCKIMQRLLEVSPGSHMAGLASQLDLMVGTCQLVFQEALPPICRMKPSYSYDTRSEILSKCLKAAKKVFRQLEINLEASRKTCSNKVLLMAWSGRVMPAVESKSASKRSCSRLRCSRTTSQMLIYRPCWLQNCLI